MSVWCLDAGKGCERVSRGPSGISVGATTISLWPHRGAAVWQPLEAAGGLHPAQQDLSRAGTHAPLISCAYRIDFVGASRFFLCTMLWLVEFASLNERRGKVQGDMNPLYEIVRGC